MNYLRLNLFICISLISIFCLSSCKTAPSDNTPKYPPGEVVMRVNLVHASKKDKITLSIPGSYSILNNKSEVLYNGEQLPETSANVADNNIVLAGKKLQQPVIIRASAEYKILINKMAYSGEIHLLIKDGKIVALNVLPMEQYLASVIGGEMPLHWPQPALIAQAIAARSYALYEHAQATDNYFDVYDTVASQVYKGVATESARSRKIIKASRGVVMLYNNSLFKSFFHSTCGGYTANGIDVFDYIDITALSAHPCLYCTESKYYQWQCRLGLEDLNMLVKDLKLKPPFLGLAIVKQDEGKRVITVKISHGKKQLTVVPAAQVRAKLNARGKQLRSTKFTIEGVGGGLLFKGNGWGHGVGMCQVGAHKMAQKGFSAEDIIQFYYPGSQLYQMWK